VIQHSIRSRTRAREAQRNLRRSKFRRLERAAGYKIIALRAMNMSAVRSLRPYDTVPVPIGNQIRTYS
jgi:hypothetical protein